MKASFCVEFMANLQASFWSATY